VKLQLYKTARGYEQATYYSHNLTKDPSTQPFFTGTKIGVIFFVESSALKNRKIALIYHFLSPK
jgi:hypothetical protein